MVQNSQNHGLKAIKHASKQAIKQPPWSKIAINHSNQPMKPEKHHGQGKQEQQFNPGQITGIVTIFHHNFDA
jgi:hypothetical protein